MEYDDEAELTRYVWDHYERLMTDFEQCVGRAIFWRQKAALPSQAPETARAMAQRGADDPDINAALANGIEVYRRQVCRRVLADHAAEVFVNRCPCCERVVRTPKARQCFWCGYDWHDGLV